MSELDDLGKRHKRLLRELEEIKAPLHDAMRAAWATKTVTQNEIRERAGYKTIQQVRHILGLTKPATDKEAGS